MTNSSRRKVKPSGNGKKDGVSALTPALEERILRVTDLSRGGAGVARDESGVVVFVPYSAPGDLLRVKLTEQHKRYAQAEIIEILEPSQERVTPPCPVFGTCGGCQWQHITYSKQWETKVKGVLHALERVQVAPPLVIDQLPADRIWEYRNRIQLRGLRDQLGFYRQGSNEQVTVSRCDIARPEINAAWLETQRQGLEKFADRSFKVELEVSASGEVSRSWNSHHSAMGFRQVHDEQNEKLRSWIAKAVGSVDTVFDLFGGSGNLSLHLKDQVREIHCVDVSSPSARTEGIPENFHFHRASTLVWILKQASQLKKSQNREVSDLTKVAILDPPREGLGGEFGDIASALETLKVSRVIAVGCDSDSWARDTSRWIKRGWTLDRLLFLDFFPQTPHIEAISVLTKNT